MQGERPSREDDPAGQDDPGDRTPFRIGPISLIGVSAVDALFWVVCLVLVVAGSSKLVAPEQVASTLVALGGPRRSSRSASSVSGVLAARVVGAFEVVLGIAGLAVGGTVIALGVSAVYVGFAVVVVVARRRGLSGCGCFGATSAPPSWVHVAVNVGSALVAAVAAATSGGPAPAADGLGAVSSSTAMAVAALVLLATALVVALDTVVADVVEATRALRDQDRGVETA